MIAYEATKKSFLEDVYNDRVDKKIEQKINATYREKEAWIDAANHMEKILRDDCFPDDISIAMEFVLYNSRSRVDFIITGLDNERKNVMIIIEFKRWRSVKAVTDRDDMVQIGNEIQQHPSYQALSYANSMKNFYSAIEDNGIIIKSCACMHRYEKTEDDAITNPHYKDLLEESPIFLNGENEKMKEFIKKYIKYGDNKETLHLIENGEIKTLKQLQDSILPMLRGEEEFSMVLLQKDVFEEAKRLARLSKKDGKKRVYVVEGKPGTGKSVIAINLVGQLIKRHKMDVRYTTKIRTPRDVYTKFLTKEFKKKDINLMFCGSGSFIKTKKNKYDAIIVDESHRITEKTGFIKRGENQIKEIINASRSSVFFIDPRQRVHIDDYGRIERIEKFSRKLGAEISYGKLVTQFRCTGGEKFIDWIESVLQYEDTNLDEIDISFLKDYKLEIIDNPNELKKKIIEHNMIQNKSRIVAGYCWDWISKKDPHGDKYDIVIPEYNFKMKWNFNNIVWAIDENSVEQAGCIHTAQSVEFDYVGVIIGNDLRYENGKIITDFTKRASGDQTIKGLKGMSKTNKEKTLEIADEIIKNTYRTLLTRGQRGCFIYCQDKALGEYLKRNLQTNNQKVVEEVKKCKMR